MVLILLVGLDRLVDFPGNDLGTGPDNEVAPVESTSTGSDRPAVADGETGPEAGSGALDDGVDRGENAEPLAPGPAERVAVGPVEPSGHWLGRGTMTEESIELVWPPVTGAETYRLHRLDGLEGFDVAVVPLDRSTLIEEIEAGSETAFSIVDRSVTAGRFYTYVLEVDVGDRTLERRWTQTLARDDRQPPRPIRGARSEVTDDGILLSWEPSGDNVEFAAYAVYLIDGEDLQYLGGGGDVEVTSFLDRTPSDGTVVYGVQASDFHDNRTELVRITVDVERAG